MQSVLADVAVSVSELKKTPPVSWLVLVACRSPFSIITA